MSKFFGTLALACVLVTSAALVSLSVANGQDPPQRPRATKAVAVIYPTDGSKVGGALRLTVTEEGLRVTGEVTGLPANSKHGFHIHEFGDMTVKDGTGMGGHFNPAGVEHGMPDKAIRHAGDMGNIDSDANGVAKIDKTFQGLTLSGRSGALGRGIIVHEKPDDGGQPTGNAGGRIGYGVIGVAKPD